MGKTGTIIKTAGGALATALGILTALRENPQLSKELGEAFQRIKSLTNSNSAKSRLSAKLEAIEACALAVEETFPETGESAAWRQQVVALRLRSDLAWKANRGKARKRALALIDEEATTLLSSVNERLAVLSTSDTYTIER